jgi:muramoyltetrapeptide carboxypeptidase LdcA involved in peptidoglycan recycling
MWQLKNAGWFENAKAIIIGRPRVKEELFGVDYKEANFSELKDLNIPVIIDADFGHISPNFPIISGGYVHVDYKKGKCKIKYDLK